MVQQSSVPRATLGQQVLDVQTKYAGQKTQTVRETTDEMGKEYMRSLQSIFEKHQHLPFDYYIVEIIQPDTFLPGAIKVKHIARRTEPFPEWGLAVYKVDNHSGDCTYLWGLPHEAEAMMMLQNPEGWERKTMQDIDDFMKGRLGPRQGKITGEFE
jgi:hypothetical protein